MCREVSCVNRVQRNIRIRPSVLRKQLAHVANTQSVGRSHSQTTISSLVSASANDETHMGSIVLLQNAHASVATTHSWEHVGGNREPIKHDVGNPAIDGDRQFVRVAIECAPKH